MSKMNFRTIKDNIVEILANNSNNCFRVIGHQRQMESDVEVKDDNRRVQIFYSFGDIPKSSGRVKGPIQHECTYRLELSASAATKGDVNTLDDTNASSAIKIAALDNLKEASATADELIDELFNMVFQILMNPTNYSMGMPKGEVSNRWIGELQKDEPIPLGSLVVLTGNMFLKLKTAEQILGVDASQVTGNIQNIKIDLAGDDIEQTEVTVEP